MPGCRENSRRLVRPFVPCQRLSELDGGSVGRWTLKPRVAVLARSPQTSAVAGACGGGAWVPQGYQCYAIRHGYCVRELLTLLVVGRKARASSADLRPFALIR